jgi:hypothetical protein
MAMAWSPFGYGPGKFPPSEHNETYCRCDARGEAMRRGDFLPLTAGWVFPHDPPRVATDAWRSKYHGTANHTGEPYVWRECPFCGHALPGCGSMGGKKQEAPPANPEGD